MISGLSGKLVPIAQDGDIRAQAAHSDAAQFDDIASGPIEIGELIIAVTSDIDEHVHTGAAGQRVIPVPADQSVGAAYAVQDVVATVSGCLLYTSPSPRD